ncbi:MAG: glycosyltransferase family 2 protein [Bacteroidales bacterium]|nr:glycosyltransferase family 2 protein [Bacteroidales bacterium]
MNNRLVSIIVPIYGVEAYIEKCVISLMEQTYSDIEYIFVDDCTKDNSIKILETTLEKYPLRSSKTNIIRHEANKGLSAARNSGLLHSTGDYIVHVDSDDYIENDFIEQCVDKIIKTDADIVFTDRHFVYANIIKESHLCTYYDIREWRNALLSGRFPHAVWGCLIRKSLYTENNILSIEGLHQGEDFAVMCRLAYYVKKIDIVRKPLYNYLVRTNIYKYERKILNDTYLSWKVVDDFYKNTGIYYEVNEILWRRMLSFYIWQIRCWIELPSIKKEEAKYIKETFPRIRDYSQITVLKKLILILFKYEFYYSLKCYVSMLKLFQKFTFRRGLEI